MSNQDTVDKYIEAACDQFNSLVKHPKILEVVSENLYDELLEEIILDICYDAHRTYKRGYLNLFPEENDHSYGDTIETESSSSQDPVKCVCPKCKKRIDAIVFSRHLAKCMGLLGLGRNSSRIANMKITNTKDTNIYASAASDNENESDWSGERKRKKRNNRNNNKRKYKTEAQTDSGGSLARSVGSNHSYASSSNFKSKNNEDKSKQICGVITKHSKKRCKNINCTHHIEQRKSQRNDGDFPIDIEGNEDPNIDNGRDSIDLNSNASSPTNSSHGSSKKRDKISKSKNKSSKKSSRYSD